MLFERATVGDHQDMAIDLGEVTFMDCGDYRAIVAARLVVEATGRTLTLRGVRGQPGRFIAAVCGNRTTFAYWQPESVTGARRCSCWAGQFRDAPANSSWMSAAHIGRA